MGWTLKLRRRPDPVITDDELRYLDHLVDKAIHDYTAEMNHGKVSESVLRNRYYAQSIQKKIQQVIAS